MARPKTKIDSQLWGLNPVFRSNVKLYIKDILLLKEIEGYPGVFQFKHHQVSRVDVVGVIVRVEERPDFFIYALDDATGVISCLTWKSGRASTAPTPKGLCPALAAKLESVHKHKEEASSGYQLGDLLHVRGKIKIYFDEMQIQTAYCVRVQDPNMEIERMLQLPILYEQCYNKVNTLPKAIADMNAQCDPNEIEILQDTETAIISEATSRNLQELTKHDIYQLHKVKGLLDQTENAGKTLDRVMVNLLASGDLFKKTTLRDDSESFMVTTICRDLEEYIIKIIKEWDPSSEFGDDCPVSHIYSAIRRRLAFTKLEMSALNRSLHKLESQSDIISTADKCYITFQNT